MDLSEYTQTGLLKLVNDTKSKHEILKERIIKNTIVIDELEKEINVAISEINELEQKYIMLIEEINNRNAI